MSKLRANRIRKMVVLLAVCGGSAMMGFVLGCSKVDTAQAGSSKLLQRSDEKVIERKEYPKEPLEFDNLAVKNVKIAPSQRVSARSLVAHGGGQIEDWLENLEFSLKNKSDKQVRYILLQLQFPETEVNGPMMAYNIEIGMHPKASEVELRYSTPLALSPDDSFTFTLSANELKMVKDFLGFRKFQLSDLNRVVIQIVSATFDDGTNWTLGRHYRPNPNAPGGYEPIDQ